MVRVGGEAHNAQGGVLRGEVVSPGNHHMGRDQVYLYRELPLTLCVCACVCVCVCVCVRVCVCHSYFIEDQYKSLLQLLCYAIKQSRWEVEGLAG